MALEFEWDENKNSKNIEKHGISFDLATQIFADPKLLKLLDFRVQDNENRLICVGKTKFLYILAVVITDRDGRIRVISARTASKQNIQAYLTNIFNN